LNDDEPELAPERFERRVEWRRADDERPEFHPEGAMDAAIPPPAERNVLLPTAALKGPRDI
jgi:hypothetical protein